MGIQHIEDLPLAAFIKAVKNIGNMRASEKLDGSNLWLGLDENGKLFTSREGKKKNAVRFYSEKEYPRFAAYNGFRSAHAALENKLEDIKRIMQPNQMVEMEILYGRQPNAVTYGAEDKSYIAFLRGVDGTPDVIADQLSTTLGGQTTKVNVQVVDTVDGDNLELVNKDINYQFTGAQRIDPSKLKDVNLNKHLDELEAYLRDSAGIEGSDLTNFDIIQNSLGSIPKEVRQEAKDKKAEITATILTKFKLPIKKELLDNYVNKIKPALGDKDISDDEDVGIEGVVLRDPSTGEMIKIVDKDAFTTINSFNHAIRNQISGVIKTLDTTAPLEARGGILGVMKTKIADLLGNVDLARGATAKKVFSNLNPTSAEDAVRKLADNLDILDFLGIKRKILAIVQQTNKDLDALLKDFKDNKDEFQLKLKNGKTIGISKEIEKRTYLVFAESKGNVKDLFEKIKKTKSVAQLIAILYGHYAKASLSNSKEISESIIVEKKQDTDKALYKKDAFTLLNIYFATVFMSILIYKANDRRGIQLLKDKAHYKLTSWAPQMSPLNFWGYPVWKANSAAVKKLIGTKAAAHLYRVAKRTAPSQSRYLHLDLSFGKDIPLNWNDHFKTMRILQQFEGMNIDRINTLMKGVFNYESLGHDAKVKLISKLFYYVQQYVPASPLFVRLKSIQNELLLNANGENEQMVQESKLLKMISNLAEDDNSDGSHSNVSVVDTVTKAQDVNPSEDKVTRKIERRKRNPSITKNKFARPKENKET